MHMGSVIKRLIVAGNDVNVIKSKGEFPGTEQLGL